MLYEVITPAFKDWRQVDAPQCPWTTDTGVLLSHPDLQGRLISGYDFIKDAKAANDGDGIDSNPDDPGDDIV